MSGRSHSDREQPLTDPQVGLTPNTKVDHFTVLRYLGGGGMGCVYLARDKALIREHAVRAGFPADAIVEVLSVLDPTMAPG